mgnify:CR=1 FL=1
MMKVGTYEVNDPGGVNAADRSSAACGIVPQHCNLAVSFLIEGHGGP